MLVLSLSFLNNDEEEEDPEEETQESQIMKSSYSSGMIRIDLEKAWQYDGRERWRRFFSEVWWSKGEKRKIGNRTYLSLEEREIINLTKYFSLTKETIEYREEIRLTECLFLFDFSFTRSINHLFKTNWFQANQDR